MLTVLSMLGGKTIGKYVIIAGVVAAVAFGIWAAVQAYNKAIEKAASVEIKLKQANTETEAANDNTNKLEGMLATQRQRTQAAQRLARVRAKRANDTSAALTRILNLPGSPAVAEFERMLVTALERGQGYKFDNTGSTDPASEASVSASGIPFTCFSKSTARAMIHNAVVTADYIDDVESSAPVSFSPTKK